MTKQCITKIHVNAGASLCLFAHRWTQFLRLCALAGLSVAVCSKMAQGGLYTDAYSNVSVSFVQAAAPAISQRTGYLAEISGTQTSSYGVTARFSATASGIFDESMIGIDFHAGGFLEVSGSTSSGKPTAGLRYSGDIVGVYDYRMDAIKLTNNSAEFAFHGNLAPGDTIYYSFDASFYPVNTIGSGLPFGAPIDFYTYAGEFTNSGDFSGNFVVPLHEYDVNPVDYNPWIGNPSAIRYVLVRANASFTFTKGGTGTSWVVLDDPSAAAFAPPSAEVPEPASAALWPGLLVVFGLARRCCAARRNRRNKSESCESI